MQDGQPPSRLYIPMFFNTSSSGESPLFFVVLGAIVAGLAMGALTVWRPRLGALWFCIVELLFPLGAFAVLVRDTGEIGIGLLLASVPSVFFLLYSLGALAVVAVPGCIIRAVFASPKL